MEKPAKLTLLYFPVQARAENIAMMMEYAKVDYDRVFTSGKSFVNDKKAGKIPYLQLPVLEIETKTGEKFTLGQSGSITRYLAKVCGLYPSDPVECALCDSLFEHAQDMSHINPIVNVYKGDTWKEKKEAFFSDFEDKASCLISKLGKGPFFLGRETPSYADFQVYHVLTSAQLAEPKCLEGKAPLLNFIAAVELLPGVKEYLEWRPKPSAIGTKPMLEPKPTMDSPIQRRFSS